MASAVSDKEKLELTDWWRISLYFKEEGFTPAQAHRLATVYVEYALQGKRRG